MPRGRPPSRRPPAAGRHASRGRRTSCWLPHHRSGRRAVRRQATRARRAMRGGRRFQRRRAERQMNRSRQGGAHLCLRDREIASGDLRAVDAGWAAQRARGSGSPGRGRSWPRRRGGRAGGRYGSGRLGPEPAQHDRRLAVRDVDRVPRSRRACASRAGVVDLRRRRHVRPEEAQVEPAEPAQRPEAVALAAHCVDGCVPSPHWIPRWRGCSCQVCEPTRKVTGTDASASARRSRIERA